MHKHLNMHVLFLILISTKKKNMSENILCYIYKIAVLYLYYDSVCLFVLEVFFYLLFFICFFVVSFVGGVVFVCLLVLLFFVDYFQKLTG